MRRFLGFSVEEQDRLPWWQHRLFVEGIRRELGDEEEQREMDLTGDAGALSEMGFTVR